MQKIQIIGMKNIIMSSNCLEILCVVVFVFIPPPLVLSMFDERRSFLFGGFFTFRQTRAVCRFRMDSALIRGRCNLTDYKYVFYFRLREITQ